MHVAVRLMLKILEISNEKHLALHTHIHILRLRRIHFPLLLFTFPGNRMVKHIYLCFVSYWTRKLLIYTIYVCMSSRKFRKSNSFFFADLCVIPEWKYASKKIVENNIRTCSTRWGTTNKKHWHKISISNAVSLATLSNLLNMHGIQKKFS